MLEFNSFVRFGWNSRSIKESTTPVTIILKNPNKVNYCVSFLIMDGTVVVNIPHSLVGQLGLYKLYAYTKFASPEQTLIDEVDVLLAKPEGMMLTKIAEASPSETMVNDKQKGDLYLLGEGEYSLYHYDGSKFNEVYSKIPQEPEKKRQKLGISMLHKDGNFYTPEEYQVDWIDDLVGIAFADVEDNVPYNFLLAPHFAIENSVAITTESVSIDLSNYLINTDKHFDAKMDYDIITQAIPDSPAMEIARNYVWADGVVGGYLPTSGMLIVLNTHFDEVLYIAQKFGLPELTMYSNMYHFLSGTLVGESWIQVAKGGCNPTDVQITYKAKVRAVRQLDSFYY